MAVSRLTDGLPITTEWLNSLTDEINLISASLSSSGTTTTSSGSGVNQIDILGKFFSNTTRPLQIVADRVTVTATAGTDVAELSPTFQAPFADNNVIVVATPSFVSQGTRKGKPFKATASVGAITSKGFLCSVSLVVDSMDFNQGKEVIVDYIAIGKKP